MLGVVVALLPPLGASDAPPMSASERDSRRTAYLDELWADVAQQYPEALRPDVSIGRTVNDRGRRSAIVGCLQDAGIAAELVFGRIEYSNRAGQSPLDVAVSYYACTAAFPTIDRVTGNLDADQLGALWDYYSTSLRPCLAASGYRTWRPPDRADFIAPDGYHTWNPYLPLRGVRLPPDEMDELDAACPVVPAWLDFRTP